MNWLETLVGTALFGGCYYLGTRDGANTEKGRAKEHERDEEIRRLREEIAKLKRGTN